MTELHHGSHFRLPCVDWEVIPTPDDATIVACENFATHDHPPISVSRCRSLPLMVDHGGCVSRRNTAEIGAAFAAGLGVGDAGPAGGPAGSATPAGPSCVVVCAWGQSCSKQNRSRWFVPPKCGAPPCTAVHDRAPENSAPSSRSSGAIKPPRISRPAPAAACATPATSSAASARRPRRWCARSSPNCSIDTRAAAGVWPAPPVTPPRRGAGRSPLATLVLTAGIDPRIADRSRARRQTQGWLAPRLRRESGGVKPTAQTTRVIGGKRAEVQGSAPVIERGGRPRNDFNSRGGADARANRPTHTACLRVRPTVCAAREKLSGGHHDAA